MKASQVGSLSEAEEYSGVEQALHQVRSRAYFHGHGFSFHARPLESWVFIYIYIRESRFSSMAPS